MLDPGTHYTMSQVGADTVIDMGTPGNQMILVGVQMSALTPDQHFRSLGRLGSPFSDLPTATAASIANGCFQRS